ncbi:MAG: hypothetical protein EBX41_02410 [Chitinophagia bacterium]|nr:hypothetical protein [Chitinophagia bacterium]
MRSNLNVGAVSYLNTKPLLYGIENSPVIHNINLSISYPSLLHQRLLSGEIDMALLPVAALRSIPRAKIVSQYGIAASGKVASVAIFSHVPLTEVKTLYLDYQSVSSVALVKILVNNYWNLSLEYLPAPPDYINQIQGTAAGVIIGDRALEQLPHFEYIYDLAEAWKLYTGLDFVFAAWVATKDLEEEFVNSFNDAQKAGLAHIVAVAQQNAIPYYDLLHYYTQNIHYFLDEDKLKGMGRFLSMLP